MRICYQRMYRYAFVVALFTVVNGCFSLKTAIAAPQNFIKTGKTITIGARMFHVIRESLTEKQDVLKLLIDGEEEIILEEINERLGYSARDLPANTDPDSIQVYELVGNPTIIHITWESQDTVMMASDFRWLYHYLVVPKGNTSQVFLKGVKTKGWTGRFAFSWTQGTYQLDYTDSLLTLIERQIEGGDDGQGLCRVKEIILKREYHINNVNVTLETCEERFRTVEIQTNQPGRPCGINTAKYGLEEAEWTSVPLSQEDIASKCASQTPGH